MGNIRVLQVNKLYYPETGGIERTVQNIAEGLRTQTETQVLVCQRKGRAAAEEVNGIPVYRAHSFGTFFSMPISLDFILRLRKMSRNQDIIHFHMPFPLGDLACLMSGYKGKVVAYWHSDVVKQKKFMRLYQPIMNRFLKRADLIITGARGNIEGSWYLKPYRDKCMVIPFAVSESIRQDGENYLRERTSRAESRDKVKFLFVGRLVYYKGCSVLIQAMQEVENAELTVIGTGELEESLKNLSRELGVENRIHFLGQVTDDEMKQCFRNTDVFVLPSVARSEAFGLVQLEAMAYGKPVINTSLPSGVPEVSLHGITGLTVEPEDVHGLATAMTWMVEHPEERQSYGMAAKQRLEENYTLDSILPKVYSAYETLLGK